MNLNNHTPSQTHLQQKKKKNYLARIKKQKNQSHPPFFLFLISHIHIITMHSFIHIFKVPLLYQNLLYWMTAPDHQIIIILKPKYIFLKKFLKQFYNFFSFSPRVASPLKKEKKEKFPQAIYTG